MMGARPRDAGMDAASIDASLDDAASEDAALDASPGDAGFDASTPTDAASDSAAADASVGFDIPADAWTTGTLSGTPPRAELLPLPGGGEGGPVLTSNNPEEYTGDGLLYGNARPSPTRGGMAYPLTGDFGVYLHHLNRSGRTSYVWILVTNPGTSDVTVSAEGSGYDQSETGGLGLGTSPDYRVSREWLSGSFDTTIAPTTIAPARPLAVYREDVPNGAEIDGRFAIRASAPVYVYVVATSIDDINEAVRRSRDDAPGDYRVSGTPPPPFGREAGVYAHDTWRASFDVAVPGAAAHVGLMVNTATGAGFSQVQAFPALAHYDQSAAEAVGMYGNVYDLDVGLAHDGADTTPRRVRATFQSLSTGAASRYWDGVATLDGVERDIRHIPGSVATPLGEFTLAPGERARFRFRAMVPGLTSIPQALVFESY